MRPLIIAVIFSLCVLFLPTAFASSVTRSFKTPVIPNEEFQVNLTVGITKGESYYLIDDMYPNGFSITTADPQASYLQSGHVKWAVIQGATNTTFWYKLKAPAVGGNFSFIGGEYMFENDTSPSTIKGQTNISVATTQLTNITAGDIYTKTFNISTVGISSQSCTNFTYYATGVCNFLFKCYAIVPQDCNLTSCSNYSCSPPLNTLANPEQVFITYAPNSNNIGKINAVSAFIMETDFKYNFTTAIWSNTTQVLNSTMNYDYFQVIGATSPPLIDPLIGLFQMWLILVGLIKGFFCSLGIFC